MGMNYPYGESYLYTDCHPVFANTLKFLSSGFHVVHLDEEPPQEIYSQALRAVTATQGIISLTFTPEDGVTQVVDAFMNELKKGLL